MTQNWLGPVVSTLGSKQIVHKLEFLDSSAQKIIHENLVYFFILPIFCLWFFVSNYSNTFRPKSVNTLKPKCVNCFLQAIWIIIGILGHFSIENYAWTLTIVQNLSGNFSCVIFWTQNFLIPQTHILLSTY